MSRPRGRPRKNSELITIPLVRRPRGRPRKESKELGIMKATLKILGRTFESQGYTIDEVLRGFQPQQWMKGVGVLRIEKDGKVKEKIIFGNHVRNIFGMASGTMREVSLKFVKQLF